MSIVDAYIEMPLDDELRSAFVGDESYSPLKLALDALAASPEIRQIIIPWNGEVSELPSDDSRIRTIALSDIEDIHARDVGRSIRSWNHAGTLHGTMMMTEFCTHANPRAILNSLTHPLPGYVLVISGTHGFITRDVIQSILTSASENGWVQALYTVDGPLGMTPALFDHFSIEQMAENNVLPQAVYWNMGRFWGFSIGHTPTEIVQCRRSFSLATKRGREYCKEIASKLRETDELSSDKPLSALAVVNAANQDLEAWTGGLPRDVEVELTTQRDIDPAYLPKLSREDATLSFEDFRKIIDQLAQYKDSVNLTLGGFGDPLCHPEVEAFIEYARPHVKAINVRTFGTRLDEEAFLKLAKMRVDVVNVRFGYWGKEEYLEANGVDGFEELSERLLAIREKQKEEGNALPLLVPEVVKGITGDKTLIDFRDTWIKLNSWPVVTSYNTFCGALENKQAIDLYPGLRRPCYKISEQLIIHADGSVPLCWQDFDGKSPIGNISEQSLADIWKSERLRKVRQSHVEAEYGREHSPCGTCNEWFRLS